jgi:hypothetical protein
VSLTCADAIVAVPSIDNNVITFFSFIIILLYIV